MQQKFHCKQTVQCDMFKVHTSESNCSAHQAIVHIYITKHRITEHHMLLQHHTEFSCKQMKRYCRKYFKVRKGAKSTKLLFQFVLNGPYHFNMQAPFNNKANTKSWVKNLFCFSSQEILTSHKRFEN